MIPGITLNIGGIDYVVPPITLGALELHQDAIDRFQAGETGLKGFSVVIDVVFAALKRNYPEVTRQLVADGIDLADAGDCFRAVMDVSGLHRKEIEAGKGKAGQ